MAGPSILVTLLADLSKFGQSMAQVGAKGTAAAKGVHEAFSGVLGALNQTGVLGPFGAALDGVDQALDQVAKHGKDVGLAMIGVGGAMAGIGAGLSALGSKDQQAHQQLQQAVQNTGHDYEDYAAQVEAAIKHQENFGHSAAETQQALVKLTDATHDPQKALALLNETADVAAVKHEDLGTAATQVGKVYNGNTKLLKDFGITVDATTKLTDSQKTATQALADVVGGQASASVNTFSGHLDVMKTKFEDMAANLGARYGPAITAVGSLLAGLGAAWSVISAIMAADWFAAFWPIGVIVLAIAAVGVAIYLLRDQIAGVFSWIADHWRLLVEILVGPFAIAAILIFDHFEDIKRWASDLWKWIVDGWNGIVAFFTGLPGRLAGIFSGMFDGIWQAFKGAINLVIDGWNSLKFTTPHVKVFGIDTPSVTIGVPSIPRLGQGGLITSDGLVYAHAGEAISPIPGGVGGPAVMIQQATFNSAVDVDMLLRKSEFAVSAGRL